MKYSVLISLFIFCMSATAEEALSENAEGITLYNVEEASSETPLSQWQSKAQEVLINALSLTGIQYKYGGKSPETGFDCSGFVRYVFSHPLRARLAKLAKR
jgi:cell wall-associated NlpC family hydrolase